ncbi:hypothetical protein V6N00_13285 [Tersicoccus sp. MR15.9]|uniref:hypothetical protein n=1 Tax=Tersicoccus mangrovi TaxID=3121635 RepID=UPI002FE5A3C5
MSPAVVRQPAGIPEGGRFAEVPHTEPDVQLAAERRPRPEDPWWVISEISHHLAPPIGWLRLARSDGKPTKPCLKALRARTGIAADAIAGDADPGVRDWVQRLLRAEFEPYARKLADPNSAAYLDSTVKPMDEMCARLGEKIGAFFAAGCPMVAAGGHRLQGTHEYRSVLDVEGRVVHQVRSRADSRPEDAPDGTAAIITYADRSVTETHYRDGRLHDGTGDTPTRVTRVPGVMTTTTRGVRHPRWGWIVDQDSPDGQPAWVRRYDDGEVETTHYTADHRQDPRPGVPARVVAYPDGRRTTMHYPFGAASDLPDGTACEAEYAPDGRLTRQVRRYDNWAWDGDDGSPALVERDESWRTTREKRMYFGSPLDGADGTPAERILHDNGEVSGVQSSRHVPHGGTRPRLYPAGRSWHERTTRAEEWPNARTEPVERLEP